MRSGLNKADKMAEIGMVTPVPQKYGIIDFLKCHIFSPRIFALNCLNQVFWIVVVTGCVIGFHRSPVSGFIVLFLGIVTGVLFLGFFYVLYHRSADRGNQKRDKAEPDSAGDSSTRGAGLGAPEN
jgi:hypothetical protein